MGSPLVTRSRKREVRKGKTEEGIVNYSGKLTYLFFSEAKRERKGGKKKKKKKALHQKKFFSAFLTILPREKGKRERKKKKRGEKNSSVLLLLNLKNTEKEVGEREKGEMNGVFQQSRTGKKKRRGERGEISDGFRHHRREGEPVSSCTGRKKKTGGTKDREQSPKKPTPSLRGNQKAANSKLHCSEGGGGKTGALEG